jgi:hypothetical protein
MGTELSSLIPDLATAIAIVNRARNQVGTLHLHTDFRDPDIFERVTAAYDRLVQAEGLLEALCSDATVWLKEETAVEEGC